MATTTTTSPPVTETLGMPVGPLPQPTSAASPGQATAPGVPGAPGAIPALPSLTPSNSPYQALALPQITSPTPLSAGMDQQPIRDLGATNKAGAIAYLTNQVLQGAVRGYDIRQARHAEQFNKKMSALSALQQQLGQQYIQAYNDVGSSSPSLTPQQILADPRVKQLHNQLLAVHQTALQAINSYLPPLQTDKKTGKQKEKRNLLERIAGNDPDEALRAYSEAASQLGPPAFYQVATPQQLSAMYQQRQGAAAGQQTVTVTAEAAAEKAANEKRLQELEAQGPPMDPKQAQAWDDEVERLRQALTPASIYNSAAYQGREDYRAALAGGYHGSFEQWKAEQSAAGRTAGAPKPVHYDNNSGTVSDPSGLYGPAGRTYTPRDLDLPLPVAAIFKSANDQQFEKQQRALQLMNARGASYLLSKVVRVVDPNNPQQTIYMRAIDAIRQHVPTTDSVWYKLQMPTAQERARADLAVSAREQLNTLDQILTHRSDLFGPAAGRKTDFTTWVGSQDPDAQRFRAAARIAADHLAGVFGGRSQAALQAIYDAIGQNKTNPAAAIAALEQMNVAAAQIQSRGAGPIAVPGAAPAGAPPRPAGPPSPQTHAFSVKAWKAAHPSATAADIDAVTKQAEAEHYKVVE